ncbi:MAG: hypothetical protein AAB429_02095 [Patescibacteria group bacterium]
MESISMAIINFSIPKTLEKQVSQTVLKKGFASRAEFFRVAAIDFIGRAEHPSQSSDESIARLVQAISAEVSKKSYKKNSSSVRQQLSDI